MGLGGEDANDWCNNSLFSQQPDTGTDLYRGAAHCLAGGQEVVIVLHYLDKYFYCKLNHDSSKIVMNLGTLSCCEHMEMICVMIPVFDTFHSYSPCPFQISVLCSVHHTVDLPIIIWRNIFSNPPFVMLILTSFYWLGRGSGTLSISICPCVWKSWNLLKTFSRLQIRCEPRSGLSACFVTGPCQSSLFTAQSYIWQRVKIVSIARDDI